MSTLASMLLSFLGGWCVSAALDAPLRQKMLLTLGIVLTAAGVHGMSP